MDVQFELNGINFFWNREKARTNLAKHDVSFEQAAEAFFDPFFRVVDASSEDEARDAVIGMDRRWNLLVVVHIVVEEAGIRIVSAGEATQRERQIYED